MAANLSDDDDYIAAINITPLVDVVLVLLIIFMITAPVIYQSSIKVQLPQAKSGESSESSPLNFVLDPKGDLFVNNKPLDWPGLPGYLRGLGPSITEQTATISADQTTPHGTVVRLMDLLRTAGLYRFALNVDKK